MMSVGSHSTSGREKEEKKEGDQRILDTLRNSGFRVAILYIVLIYFIRDEN